MIHQKPSYSSAASATTPTINLRQPYLHHTTLTQQVRDRIPGLLFLLRCFDGAAGPDSHLAAKLPALSAEFRMKSVQSIEGIIDKKWLVKLL